MAGKEDAANSIILLLISLGLSSSGSLFSSSLGISLGSQLLGEGLLGIFLASHLTGSLGTVIGTGLGSTGHNLLSSLGLKINQGNVGVLKTNSLHGLDVSTTV